MPKLIISTQSEVYSNTIKDALNDEWEIYVCTDTSQIVDTMKYLQPEAMVLDLNMPGKDGLTILSEAFPRVPPATLAVTNFTNDYVARVCMSLGVKYIIEIPCSTKYIRDRLEDMIEDLHHSPTAVMQHLRVLGLRSGADGYRYLCSAIPFFAKDMNQALHKEVYPYVVDQCNAVSIEAIEHSIRISIKKAWANHHPDIWSAYFPVDPEGNIECPTNREFIMAVAGKL